ncbi:class III cytochrome C family protein [uncultured Thiodictyon sp.]|uniref:class III cytochrome C family protein n=1 Tax=uncultured Thiodictyon sp. TaxID=1846217 RepID=UPI0025F583A2|nr:class III cytochrome C family protein [uncultured Thiodictyon sp.]
MNRQRVFYVVAANLVVLLALVLLYPHLMIAPGHLIKAHAALEHDCFACHTPLLGSRPARCQQCHRPNEIGLVTTKGLPIVDTAKLTPFHQGLVERDCVACHSDHRGVRPYRQIARFSHRLLQGSLLEQCSGCHRAPKNELHQALTGNCGQCHNQQAWTPATFDHDRFFRLDGDHNTTCITCHRGNDYTRYTCYGCHEHSRAGIREKHVEEGIYNFDACVECHRSGDDKEGGHQGRSGKRGEGKDGDADEDEEKEDDD